MTAERTNPLYDYKKFCILYVDDEERALSTFARLFKEDFRILTAPSAQEAYRLLEAHRDEIGVLMTDQRMPGEKGVWLLEKTRQLCPRVIRILVTAYTDHNALSDAVNSGAIYKYISKPWTKQELEMTLRRALEFFMVQRERDQLLREKLSTLHKLVITDRVISMGVLASGLGHHVRNALVAVRTFIDLAPEMLYREDLDMEALRYPNFWGDFYKKVQQKMGQIVRLLDDLEEAADRPAFEFLTEFTLHDALETVRRKQQCDWLEKKLSVFNEIPAELPAVWADRGKLCRFFELFFQDELLCLPPDSTVRVGARETKLGSAELRAVELLIQDDGPGLPEDCLRALFDPFFVRSGHPQEFGLNLLACYFIIYHHGGQMRVKPNAGKGMTFVITLPIDPKELPTETEEDFLNKVLMNERLWERLLANA